MNYDSVLRKGWVYLNGRFEKTDIGIKNGIIEKIGTIPDGQAEATYFADGLHILPGVIDTQVHFREPGLEHKEDLETGTLAALTGGVTGVFEMPNTKPPTITKESLTDKLNRMKNRAWCDYSFYIGAAEENLSQLRELEVLEGCCGVKVFMGSSTGSLLVSDDFTLEKILKNGNRRVAIHAEDEGRLKERYTIAQQSQSPTFHPVWRDEDSALIATKRIVKLSEKTYRPIHLLHVSTAQEMAFLKNHKNLVTVECLPQYLTLHAPECYEQLGTLAQMNPPVRDRFHQEALWKALTDGTIDILATDHAPHTLQEKQKPYPQSPSGMPGVQTLLPIMLNHVHNKKLSLEKLVELTSVNPSKIFKIQNRGKIELKAQAYFSIVDTQKEMVISSEWLKSKCGWSPFEGMKVMGWPVAVVLKGEVVMWENEILTGPKGSKMIFSS